MTISPDNLRKFVSEDEFGLLRLPAKSGSMSSDQRLAASFNEIVHFVEEHGREPKRDTPDMTETRLAMRLEAITNNEEQRVALKEIDMLGLLNEPIPPSSLDELLASDASGLLEEPDEDIFDIQHLPSREITPAEVVAQRKPCEDFPDFAPLFKECHADLRAGRRHLIPFRREQQIPEGSFFVLRGLLLYVAEVGERLREHGRPNARLRCIFENGTEADLLLRSLASQLYKSGKRVTAPLEEALTVLELRDETPMATVYVLRSLSQNPQVTALPHLHKIGSTKHSMATRIGHAERSTTFLNAPVEIVAEYEVPAGVEKKVETMLHRLFSKARMDIWFERHGQNVAEANEWFAVPLSLIDEAVTLIQSEAITNYEYDRESQQLRLPQ